MRWTDAWGKAQVLNPPEFYFELEVKRLAAELKAATKADMPEPTDGNPDYEAQTFGADLQDFDAAIEAKAIQPPDVEKATEAHKEMRKLLGTVIRGVEQATLDAMEPEDRIKPLKLSKEIIEEPAAPAEFASEFADYHRGALSFRCGNFDKAKETWKALLARPAAERKYRTTWALFMLGKAAIEAGAWDEAIDWFVKTREAAAGGFLDSIGLASAGLGWQAFACQESGRLGDAARLYLEQLASGDTTAIRSLHYLKSIIFNPESDLDKLVRDPVLQRICTATVVSDSDPYTTQIKEEDLKDDLGMRWLLALEKADAKNVRDADRVAWVAYSRGKYDKAARWLERANPDAPFSLWLKAKLAMRDGKLDAAAKLLSRALEKFPPSPELVSRSLMSINEIPPEQRAGGDLGMLRLGRGEFLSAFRAFLNAGHFSDAFYLADAVLTVDELKRFIDDELSGWEKERTVKRAVPSADENAPEETRETLRIGWDDVYQDPRAELRSILARRYVRAERFADARPYLTEESQGILDGYVAALGRANQSNAGKAERSAAFWEAAEIMVDHGDSLADFFDPISIARRLSGKVVETGPNPVIAMKYTDRETLVPPVTKGEKDRLKQNSVPSIRRYYSLYLAADLAWRAASLLPDNDEKTAELLNTAGNWLKSRDDGAADRFYQAIEKRCSKTELGKEAIKRHWFVPTGDRETN